MKCKRCGVEIPAGSKYCPNCGLTQEHSEGVVLESEGQNTSGTGRLAILPAELKGWNWGAFWLSWIWGIRNRTWIAFLAFIPYFSLVWAFILGAKGNKWAWQNQKWDSIEQYKASQRRWAMWGLIIFIIFITSIIVAWAFFWAILGPLGFFLWPS